MGICESKSKEEKKSATPQQINNTNTPHLANNIATPQIINNSKVVNEGKYPQPTIQPSTSEKNFVRFPNNTQNQAGLNLQVPGDFDRPSNIDRHVSLGSSINMDDDSMADSQPRNTLVSNN